ncbi:hypothetical protein [Dermatobacter hominis]|uniref:hypothetical protein n=1 Tax=Dermatobacter hominis TaxID=2884263 RepID=UPI001D11D6E5|nr:hypothetical protein [Dermatobacter hominis]UDY38113.1 hypothetical protein LH044_15090 [Dermatobacter hominis]
MAPPYAAQSGAPPYAAPPGGAPPAGYPGAAPEPTPAKKGKAGLIVGLLVVLLLVVGGVVAFLVANRDSGSDLTATIDTCTIDADGTLTAAGTLRNEGGSESSVKMTVEFRNSDGDAVVDKGTTDVQAPGDGSTDWDVSGSAPDDVQRVTCVVTKIGD